MPKVRMCKALREVWRDAQKLARQAGVEITLASGGKHHAVTLSSPKGRRKMSLQFAPRKPEEVRENFSKQVRRACQELGGGGRRDPALAWA